MDPEDPNTVGTRTDGTKFALPGIDSLNVSARSPAPACEDSLWSFCVVSLLWPAGIPPGGAWSDRHCAAGSAQLWGLISGAVATSPRDEVPLCIDHPLFGGSSALIVGDFKLLLGPQTYAYWQGPEFPVSAP